MLTPIDSQYVKRGLEHTLQITGGLNSSPEYVDCSKVLPTLDVNALGFASYFRRVDLSKRLSRDNWGVWSIFLQGMIPADAPGVGVERGLWYLTLLKPQGSSDDTEDTITPEDDLSLNVNYARSMQHRVISAYANIRMTTSAQTEFRDGADKPIDIGFALCDYSGVGGSSSIVRIKCQNQTHTVGSIPRAVWGSGVLNGLPIADGAGLQMYAECTQDGDTWPHEDLGAGVEIALQVSAHIYSVPAGVCLPL